MKKILLLLLHVFVLCIFLNLNVAIAYMSNFDREESSTSYGFSRINDNVVLNQVMDLKNINVKFTQNDNSYIFHITGNSSINIYNNFFATSIRGYTSAPVPLLYKKENFANGMTITENSKVPFADYKSGNLFKYFSVSIQGESLAYYNYDYNLKSNGSREINVNSRGSSGSKYFIPSGLRNTTSARSKNYSGATSYPMNCENNGIGVRILHNSSNYSYSTNDVLVNKQKCLDTYYCNINTKVEIAKQYITDYRYICFAQSYAFCDNKSISSLIESASGISICSQTIDLFQYVNCDHEWQTTKNDRQSHKKYCKNCEWEKVEPHDLLYEYDGIKYNVCTCSYIDKVKYYFNINDDKTKEIIELIDTGSEYTQFKFTNKKGYKFKYYNKYEKRFDDYKVLSTVSTAIKTHYVATCSEMDEISGQWSVIYEAVYNANQFTIIYENINNMGLELNGVIQPQVVIYDKTSYLKKNIKHIGYSFKGWSLNEGGDEINFSPLQEITNYTDENLKKIAIYPIYKILEFNVSYNSGSGKFLDGSNHKVVKYSYFDNNDFETIILNNSTDSIYGFRDSEGHIFYTMKDLKKFMYENELEGETISISPIVNRSEYSRPERTDDEGNGGGKEGKGKGDPNGGPGVSGSGENVDNDQNEINGEKNNQNDDEIKVKYFKNYETNDKLGMINKNKLDNEMDIYEKMWIKYGVSIASLSIIKKPFEKVKGENIKLKLLLLFIKNNFTFFVIFSVLLLIILIFYEILLYNYYKEQVEYVETENSTF